MRLTVLHESFVDTLKAKVTRRIDKGESRLKKLLRATDLTIDDVRNAILKGKCLSIPNSNTKALGPTYMEQAISGILRDLVRNGKLSPSHLNVARKYFGLDKLSPKEMRRHSARPSRTT